MDTLISETPTAATTRIDPPAPEDVGQVIGKLMEDVSAATGVLLTLLGQRLGTWQALAEASGLATVAELASTSGTAEPYLREWLRSQTAPEDGHLKPWVGPLHRSRWLWRRCWQPHR